MLNWNPLWAILLLSFVISLVIVVLYRVFTDQTEMKQLKDQLKEHQTKMKKLKDDPAKLMKVQKEAMGINMQYMKKSMKPTLITFIPILLIFGWMNAHFAYEPIIPGQEFNVLVEVREGITGNITTTVPEGINVVGETEKKVENNQAKFTFKGKEGDYFITVKTEEHEADIKVLITNDRNYAEVIQKPENKAFKSITIENKTLKLIWGLSWIWIYIISAIVFSIGLRKILNVH